MKNLFEDHDGNTAEFSECGTYRYFLTREWADGPCVSWLMLNPSTADAVVNDHTISKCIGFSKQWGFGRLIVVNLFALRSTDPRALARNTDPVGPNNDWWITQAAKESRELVCAWGCQQHLTAWALKDRPRQVLERVIPASTIASCLGRRKDGAPRHPLMLAYDTPRERW